MWPHDTAIVAAGLARYGFDGAAQKLIFGLLDAAAAQGGRLPELFSGLDRGELTVPSATRPRARPRRGRRRRRCCACGPCSGSTPGSPTARRGCAPNLPEGIGYLKVEGIPLAGSRVTVEVGDEVPGGVSITGLPPEIEVVREPRRPSTAV